MAFSDFDGTLRRGNAGNAAYELAVACGREREAKEIYFDIHSKGKVILREEKNPIKKLDMLYQSLLQLGSGLLQGVPITKISEISYKPTPQFSKIVEIAEKEGSLDIGTLTHDRFVERFIEANKEKFPHCKVDVVSASKLEENNGFFTGEIKIFSGIEAKMHRYTGGSVFANSPSDTGVCMKASESGYPIYVMKDNGESILRENAVLEDFLERSGITFSYL